MVSPNTLTDGVPKVPKATLTPSGTFGTASHRISPSTRHVEGVKHILVGARRRWCQ
jgi:hypothetical protein